jgi:hypothetical protein
MGTTMSDRTAQQNQHRSYSVPPHTPWLIAPTPRLSQELLVRNARTARALGRDRLTRSVGSALQLFYADVLKEPLPPALVRLAQAFQARLG